MKRKEVTLCIYTAVHAHTSIHTSGTKASRWQHFQPTSSRTNGIGLAATEHLRAASGITPQHQQHIFVIYPLAIQSPWDIWDASSNDADVPVRWFCVVCPKAARHIHLWNNPIALFLPHLTGVLRGLLMGVICPLVLSKWSKYIWVDVVAAQMPGIAWNQKESLFFCLVLEWKMSETWGGLHVRH